MKLNIVGGDAEMNLVKQHRRQILDLGDIATSALAGVISSRVDGIPRLAPDGKGQSVMYATIESVPYQFSRRAGSIVVHAGGGLMNMGSVSEETTLSYIRGIFEPQPISQ